jgi:hypothetical protein
MVFGTKVEKQVATFATDLLTLEINTIIKDNMSATKMPPARHALIDIGNDYQFALTNLQATVTRTEKAGSWDAFDSYREAAKDRLEAIASTSPAAAQGLDPNVTATQYMLLRIKETSDQLKSLLNRHDKNDFTRADIENKAAPPLKLSGDDIVLLRKAWEIMTERVVAQTVIQLDGDVITRIGSAYVNDPMILKIHRENVDVSVAFWSTLIGIVKDSLAGLISAILRL